jgi:Protein of unknown function (DUF3014)
MEAYKKMMWGSTIIVVIMLVTLMIYFFFFKSNGNRASQQQVNEVRSNQLGEKDMGGNNMTASQPPGLEAKLPAVEPPDFSLNESDEPVRELLKTSSEHRDFNRWLLTKDIIRKLVAVVDNISNGVSPRAHLDFLQPKGNFKVQRKSELTRLDPRSYIRYQPFIMTFLSLKTEDLVTIYITLTPLINEAYRELGYPDKSFSETLNQAFDQLLNTPVEDKEILLEEKIKSFAFTEPRLENLNDAQKHLLRMGPQNIRDCKRKLKEIRDALRAKKIL